MYKKILYLFAAAALFSACGQTASGPQDRLTVNDKKIDAMASSFKDLGGGYAKDAFNVFYYGKKMDASAPTFKILEGGYSKDAFNVFYYGRKVEDAHAPSFKYTGDGYAEDTFNAFYRGRKLD